MDVRKYDGARVIIGFSESMAAIGRLAVEDERVYLDDAWFVPPTGTANVMKDHAFARAFRASHNGDEGIVEAVYQMSRPELNPSQIAIITRIDDLAGDDRQNHRSAK